MSPPAAKSADFTDVLLVRTRRAIYALALEAVVETMRPLPAEPVPGMPAFLRGLAVIRGEPVPVVSLGVLIGGQNEDRAERFVLVRAGHRRVAIAVEAVLGVSRLERSVRQSLPPLIQDTDADLVAAVGVRDGELLLILQAAHLVPDDVWRRLARREASA